VADVERRCPACGALVATDARWCGQCFGTLDDPEPGSEPDDRREPDDRSAGATVPASATPGSGQAFWPCTVCGTRNPIAADVCATCGTPFAAVMRTDERPVSLDPGMTLRRSLAYPGLGHRDAGLATDGFVRGMLFTICAVMTVLMLFTGLRSAATVAVLVIFGSSTVGVYVVSAVEAGQLARGGGLVVSSKILLWASVGLVVVGIALLGVAVVTQTPR